MLFDRGSSASPGLYLTEGRKEILPAWSMIVQRAGEVRLEGGKLRVRLRKFRNPEIDYAARRLCEDLNRMAPTTLDRFRIPLHYEVA